MLPENFDDVLAGPSYLINMDRCIDRWPIMRERITSAGFKNLVRVKGADGLDGDRRQKWLDFGVRPDFIDDFKSDGRSGCSLSHVYLLQHMVDNNIPFANIFEDDVLFHKDWHDLAPMFYGQTDRTTDMVFYGSQGAGSYSNSLITSNPVFCLHAYLITLDGAKILLKALRETQTLIVFDCIVINLMKLGIYAPFRWQCWNALMYPDPARNNKIEWRNDGLVFQDDYFVSNIECQASDTKE